MPCNAPAHFRGVTFSGIESEDEVEAPGPTSEVLIGGVGGSCSNLSIVGPRADRSNPSRIHCDPNSPLALAVRLELLEASGEFFIEGVGLSPTLTRFLRGEVGGRQKPARIPGEIDGSIRAELCLDG